MYRNADSTIHYSVSGVRPCYHVTHRELQLAPCSQSQESTPPHRATPEKIKLQNLKYSFYGIHITSTSLGSQNIVVKSFLSDGASVGLRTFRAGKI